MSSPNAFPPRLTLGGPLESTHCVGRNLVRYVSHEIYGRMTGKQEVVNLL
jgi:hypothetical protein